MWKAVITSDGTEAITKADILGGVDTSATTILPCDSLHLPAGQFVLRMTMGSVTEYFRPLPGLGLSTCGESESGSTCHV